MPEGPEVQTVVSALSKVITGKTIKDVAFPSIPNVVHPRTPEVFQHLVTEQKIVSVYRRGKFVNIELLSGQVLVIHLLMTGQLIIVNDENYPKFARLIFSFTDGSKLCLADKSGWVKVDVIDKETADDFKGFKTLGIDVFSDAFTLDSFVEIFKTRKQIAPVLLDQNRISGLGNIYVNEVLFLTGIYPERSAASLSYDEKIALYYAIKHIMRQALRHKGTTFSDYRTPDGGKGNYQNYLRVFKRAGKPCTRCGNTIVKKDVGSRSAFFCPVDQHDEEIKVEDKSLKQVPLGLEVEDSTRHLPNYIFLLVGPSSVGKSSLANQLITRLPFFEIVPTVKTRPKRPGEVDGQDGIFVSSDEFESLDRQIGFVIQTEIDGYRYGTPKGRIEDTLKRGKDAILVVSPEGASELKALYPNAYTMALMPPSQDVLEDRLKARADYSIAERLQRSSTIGKEINSVVEYDYQIICETQEQTFLEACDIIYGVRCQTDVIL